MTICNRCTEKEEHAQLETHRGNWASCLLTRLLRITLPKRAPTQIVCVKCGKSLRSRRNHIVRSELPCNAQKHDFANQQELFEWWDIQEIYKSLNLVEVVWNADWI